MESFVYILASKKNGTLYVGVTKFLGKRIWQYTTEFYDGFTKRCGVKSLVYYEKYSLLIDAIAREKQIKKWNRMWKIRLIEKNNPQRKICIMKLNNIFRDGMDSGRKTWRRNEVQEARYYKTWRRKEV